MVTNTFRRASTTSDAGSSNGESSRRPSAPEPRRSSIASLSLRLTRSKKSQSSTSTISEETSRLGQLFFSLPSEVQVQVLCYLELVDILALRRTSHSAVAVLNENAPSITRTILAALTTSDNARYMSTLYPMPIPCRSTFYLLQQLRRHNTIARMIRVIINFIQMKIYMIKTGPRVENFAKYRSRLAAILYPGAWTVQHFLESYRNLLVHIHPKHTQSKFWPCPDCSRAINDIVASYPVQHLIPAYQFYALALLHLRASSRAPTYAGSIERRLRGWSRKPPSDDDLTQLLLLGGLEQLSRISIMRGTYNQRLEVIHSFLDKISSDITAFRITFGADGSKHFLREREAEFMQAVDVPYEHVTESVVESLPALGEVLAPEFHRRILEEGLVGDESELASPFAFVQGCIVDEGEKEAEWGYHVFGQYT